MRFRELTEGEMTRDPLDKSVSEQAFDGAKKHFGEIGIVDLTGISGDYTLVSMALNLNRQPLSDGIPPLLRALDR